MPMSARCSIFALLFILPALSASTAFGQRTPEEQLKALRVPNEMEISLFASEPMITNPAAIDVDTHGRVWVAEIQWYRKAAKDPPSDQIKVLEDTDGDGKADKATIFADNVFCPMSICVAGDKVYVATSPDLWVYEDKNGDLKADGPPKKLLSGFGGFNHDHGAHSLALGPDHKWWMSHGDAGFKVTGTDGSQIEYRWGAMLRGELDGSKLEQIAVNFRNPYEIAVSSFGESYCSDNDNDGNFSVRICWILDGGNYGWFGSPPFKKNELETRVPPGTPFAEHWHFRGYIPGFVPATLVTGFGSPCGMCFYEGDAFGERFKNAPLHADAGPREVRIYRHKPAGYGKQATSENLIISDGDNYFRPDDICVAPDDSLLVSDWYDGGVGGHAYNDPDRGRIFLLRPKGKRLARQAKPGPYQSIDEAIAGLKSPNLATQFLARERLLAEGANSVPALKKLLSENEPNHRARALWVLDRLGGDAREAVIEALQDSDAEFRALAVRILRRHGHDYADALFPLASDASPAVQREVLLAIASLDSSASLEVLARLAAGYDGRDRYQLETIHIAAGSRKEQLYDLLSRQKIWSVEQLPLMQLLNPQAASQYIVATLSQSGLQPEAARKLLEMAGNTPGVEAGRSLLKLASNTSASAELRRLALGKVTANLSGNWKELTSESDFLPSIKELLAEPDMQSTALALVGDQAIGELSPEVRSLATSASLAPEVRRQAIRVAMTLGTKGLAAELRKLLADPQRGVQQEALAALVDLQDMTALREILTGGAAAEVKSQAVDRLMTSTGGALVLLRLVDRGGLPQSLREAAITKGTSHADSNVRVLYEKFIPAERRPKRLGEAIQAETILALKGDAARGEKIFFQSSAAQCKNCHVVGGVGSTLGPDLSQIGKKYEKKTLLETILEPSKAISHEYVPYLLETDAGQVFAGFLVEKSDKQVALRDVKNQLIRVPASEVVTLEAQQKSLMPELVLRDVTAQDAADLLAYLSSLTSSVQHVGRFKILGPFPSRQGNERVLPPEKNPGRINDQSSYKGLAGVDIAWHEVPAESKEGLVAFDQVKYCRDRKMRTDEVAFFYAIYADSAAEQDAKLLLGSDDSAVVWLNGQQVHAFQGSRAIGFAQDKIPVRLSAGRNLVLIKVENHNGPGGVALSLETSSPLQLHTQ
jgi:putative membrane-bound dehydrogenase-like protein